jgi:hypothetical protein
MPVTARLSKLFYDRLGEEIANELVDWLAIDVQLFQRNRLPRLRLGSTQWMPLIALISES